MIPIQDLLNKILWDRDFGRGSFEIGYYDRVRDVIVKVPFQDLMFTPGDHFAFHIFGPAGEWLTIPFHRVREVYRDGELIWKR